ncbi:MAG: hypothetical protein HYX96_09575 [Chloroflexi bacterium]|nr:hypothetical protein [Chloroflexota bacterium]
MTVEGLFLDYDGTLSPIDTTRKDSRVPDTLRRYLERICRLIPVGIMTTKDTHFVRPRTPFARAWSGIGGLETVTGDRATLEPSAERRRPCILEAVKFASRYPREQLYIEEKRDQTGRTLAFCVDWRYALDRAKAAGMVKEIMIYCKSLPLVVVRLKGKPFFDVYPDRPDKGRGLIRLKRLFNLQAGVVYLGDSVTDNPALAVADMGIGILHDEPEPGLKCRYFLRYEDVGDFLRRLLENNLTVDASFAGLIREKG